MHVRLPMVVASVLVAFTGGLASSRWLVPEAHAQAMPLASTVYVPSDGLAFRRFDGRIVARLSYDSSGGAFELYDEHEQPATRVRGDALARPGSTSRPPSKRDPLDLGF
jgi:hypothetical protein